MPRTAAAAFEVTGLARQSYLGEPRLTPPAGLDANTDRAVREVLASVAPSHFRPCDLPLVVEYATATLNTRGAAEIVAREGLLKDDKPHPALRILRTERAAMSLLASRLRLTPASRRDGRTASGSTDVPQTGPLQALAYLRETKRGI